MELYTASDALAPHFNRLSATAGWLPSVKVNPVASSYPCEYLSPPTYMHAPDNAGISHVCMHVPTHLYVVHSIDGQDKLHEHTYMNKMCAIDNDWSQSNGI